MNCGYWRQLTFRTRAARSAVLACGVGAALLLSLGTAARGAGGASVVSAKGKIAGEGYAYYLERFWKITTFATSPPAKPCQTMTVKGQRVGLLTPKTIAPMKESYRCNIPAGQPVYAVELSNECSTFKGDHGTYGTSDSQLRKCARALFKGVKETATVDGHSVSVTKLVATTGVYPVVIPKKNYLGTGKAGKGRSAAHGYGLLLTGFPAGTHVIHTIGSIGTSKWDITWTVNVR